MQSKRLGRWPRPERILVIRLGALGDVLRTLPAVSALRRLHPVSHLCWLVEPGSEAAVALSGVVDETLVFPRGELVRAARRGDLVGFVSLARRFFRRLRARRFEIVIDFHGLLKSGLFAWISGAPVRLGHGFGTAREGAALFSNERVELPDPHVSRYARNAALVRALAPSAPIPEGPLLAAPAAARARLEEGLAAIGHPAARGFVLIHPGSSPSASHKRYAVPAWVEVSKRLADAGHAVWITAGPAPDERALADRIVAAGGGRFVAAPPTASFEELVALIERAGVFAACDSGPLHAATLCGVPVVQVLGPTDPVHNEPGPASRWRRVHVPLPCSPCRRGCADPACMRAIPPALVAEAVDALAGAAVGSTGQRDPGP
ncbi:MAG: glycosyltransferase family 9 protein [Myxococcota bacterium]